MQKIKTRVDKDTEVYNRSMKSSLQDDGVEMHFNT